MSILSIVWDFVHKSHLVRLIQVLDLPPKYEQYQSDIFNVHVLESLFWHHTTSETRNPHLLRICNF